MFPLMPLVIALVGVEPPPETAWEVFLNEPTPANAARVETLAYSSNQRGVAAADLQILQNQVLARDSEAFRLAIRLYRAADGAVAENLGVLLGRTARSQPEFFLREVAALDMPCSVLSWALKAPGLEYVDRPKAQAYEIKQRQLALRSVGSPALRGVIADCLGVFSPEGHGHRPSQLP